MAELSTDNWRSLTIEEIEWVRREVADWLIAEARHEADITAGRTALPLDTALAVVETRRHAEWLLAEKNWNYCTADYAALKWLIAEARWWAWELLPWDVDSPFPWETDR